MAQTPLDRETFFCSICLDLLKDPVTLNCGHSYCMNCLKGFWDTEDPKAIYSCPQCRRAFTPRPVLQKNTMLAAVVQQLKKTGHTAAPLHQSFAGAEDVACDICTGRKLKALKSCLVCLVSYCEKHLQPHRDVAPLKKHKLVEPSSELQENVCSRHGEVMKMFCRTDQQLICYLCPVEEHKGHDTVSAAAELTERLRDLYWSQLNVQRRIQETHKDQKTLQVKINDINRSAGETVNHIDQTFDQLICLIGDRRSGLNQQVRLKQQTEVRQVRELQKELQQKATELKRTDVEMEKLSHAEDLKKFLHGYASLPALGEATPSVQRPRRHFEDVRAAVTQLRDGLQDFLTETRTKVSQAAAQVDVLLPQPEPKTRDEFFRCSPDITLDPNTLQKHLLLSQRNRKVTNTCEDQSHPRHPERFTDCPQVLSRERLPGRCYWEVELTGGVNVAVAYESVSRAGRSESAFGFNDKSWLLVCVGGSFTFWYNSVRTPVSGPVSSRVGVYLDHSAGVLSFYSVSDTKTLLHRVQTTFTEPLYAGLYVFPGATAEFSNLR